MDLMLFSFSVGAQDAIPNITDASAIRRFQKKFGHICKDCTEESLRKRLERMREEYTETLKS